MKKENLNTLSVAELQNRIKSEVDALNRLKFAHAISPIENPMKIRDLRKGVAKLKTVLTQKQKSVA